jgi:hypothetical protein
MRREVSVLAWMWLPLLCSGVANAKSVLVVQFDRPVVVVVNMKPYTPSGDSVVVEFPDGGEGTQNVRIRNLLGQQQWAGRIDVPAGHKVKLSWELQNMTVGEPELLEPPEERPKLTDQGYDIVDGQLVKLKPGQQQAAPQPAPAPEPRVPRAPSEDPFLTVVEEVSGGGTTPPQAEPPGEEGTDTDASATPAPSGLPPLPAGVGEVWFHNRNTTWTNIHVDGQLHEVRQQDGFRVQLPPGEHMVRIGDFRDKETWWEGKVRVGEGQRLELQFSRADPPRVMDHPDAWTEAP